MRWILKVFVVIGLGVLALSVYGAYGPAIPISSVVTQKQDFFSATGEGKVTAVPDVAKVSLGVTATGRTVSDVQQSVNTVINAVVTDLQTLGIEKKDIETSRYSISPQYDYQQGAPRITGYAASAAVSVTVRKLDVVNQTIDRAAADGANQIGGVELTVNDDELKKLTQEAREKAVANAKDKAASLAAAAGVTLGRIVNIEESSMPTPGPIYRTALKTADGTPSEDTRIEPGSTDITSTVTLSFELR